MNNTNNNIIRTDKRTLALGVSGSIAAYKACELTRLFVKNNFDVFVVMTAAAQRFVAPLSFQTLSRHPVYTDMFAPMAGWEPSHVSIADKCAALVVAPCTANVIAKIARGIADDALSSLALAFGPKRILVAPAMNVAMYENPATQENIATLRARGAMVLEPGVGDLACGVSAKGRMPAPAEIFQACSTFLTA